MVRSALVAALLAAAPLGAQCAPCAQVGITSIVGGWLDQTRDDPKQWSRDAGGFATRIGSRLGQGVISTSVTYGVGRLIGAKALVPLVAGQTVGAFAGAYTAMAWRPGRYDAVKGYQFALTALAVNVGVDIVREIVR